MADSKGDEVRIKTILDKDVEKAVTSGSKEVSAGTLSSPASAAGGVMGGVKSIALGTGVGVLMGSTLQPAMAVAQEGLINSMRGVGDAMGLFQGSLQETMDAYNNGIPILRDWITTEERRVEIAKELNELQEKESAILKIRQALRAFYEANPGMSPEMVASAFMREKGAEMNRYLVTSANMGRLFEILGVQMTEQEMRKEEGWSRVAEDQMREAGYGLGE